ncbi:MAG: very short patch repair endonuclease [Planctomycetia bacterium]|nr:very short patch repair endonuclease [Planctomycetia bacterium]
MDIKTVPERSQNMAKIHSKNTRPELYIRSLLHKRGFRFRVSGLQIFGKPDLFFTKKRIAVFIHGCFWHRHKNCKYTYIPKSNVSFWLKKFRANVLRDNFVKSELLKSDIFILVIWECTVKKMKSDSNFAEQTYTQISNFLQTPDSRYFEL